MRDAEYGTSQFGEMDHVMTAIQLAMSGAAGPAYCFNHIIRSFLSVYHVVKKAQSQPPP